MFVSATEGGSHGDEEFVGPSLVVSVEDGITKPASDGEDDNKEDDDSLPKGNPDPTAEIFEESGIEGITERGFGKDDT